MDYNSRFSSIWCGTDENALQWRIKDLAGIWGATVTVINKALSSRHRETLSQLYGQGRTVDKLRRYIEMLSDDSVVTLFKWKSPNSEATVVLSNHTIAGSQY